MFVWNLLCACDSPADYFLCIFSWIPSRWIIFEWVNHAYIQQRRTSFSLVRITDRDWFMAQCITHPFFNTAPCIQTEMGTLRSHSYRPIISCLFWPQWRHFLASVMQPFYLQWGHFFGEGAFWPHLFGFSWIGHFLGLSEGTCMAEWRVLFGLRALFGLS